MEVFAFAALHGIKYMVVSPSQVVSMVMVRLASGSCGAEWREALSFFVQEESARRENNKSNGTYFNFMVSLLLIDYGFV